MLRITRTVVLGMVQVVQEIETIILVVITVKTVVAVVRVHLSSFFWKEWEIKAMQIRIIAVMLLCHDRCRLENKRPWNRYTPVARPVCVSCGFISCLPASHFLCVHHGVAGKRSDTWSALTCWRGRSHRDPCALPQTHSAPRGIMQFITKPFTGH